MTLDLPPCPNCGQSVALLDAPGSPPFGCHPCARAWWPSEIVTGEARTAWNPNRRAHEGPHAEQIRAAAAVEAEDAAAAGTALITALPYVPDDKLRDVDLKRMRPGQRKQVNAELAARKAR